MSRVLASSALLLAALPAAAGDWPQFRGPGGGGVSDETGLPVRWSATENVRWKADLPGRGLSNPVIAGGRVYVTACSGWQQERLHVLCLDPADGSKLWERQLRATGNTQCHPKTCMAAPTPATDGRHVYALFATGDLACFDRDGNLRWYRSLVGDYPNISNQVGMAASPVLWRDVLVVPMETAAESFLAGLDARTGRNRWKVRRPREINWTTPLVVRHGGRDLVLFQSSRDLSAYDPATGEQVWRRDTGFSTIPSPTAGDGLVFAAGGPLTALRPGQDGAEPEVAWQSSRLRVAGYPSPLYYRGRVYVIGSVGLNCGDAATGKDLWQQRAKGPFSASPVAGDGKIYLVSEEGVTTVVEAGDKPKVLATNSLGEKVTILATPAIADGALFLRSDQHVYCIDGAKGD